MSLPWSAPRLGALFGYMHEDTAIESSLLPPGGRALCVLSAGDMAFELLRAGASRVVAADPNLAQHELVRWKLHQAAAGKLAHATGSVDRRLQWLARWMAPLVFPRHVQQRSAEDLRRHFKTHRWRLAWRLLSLGMAVAFPPPFRRYLPQDVVERLRLRFESACARQAGDPSPWLQRMLCCQPEEVGCAWASTWPDAGMLGDERLTLSPTLLHQTGDTAFGLVAASNILDTAPAEDLLPMLAALAPQVSQGGHLVLRSLFRESGEWPDPPAGWVMDNDATSRLSALDRSPLCRVSVILRRTAGVASH